MKENNARHKIAGGLGKMIKRGMNCALCGADRPLQNSHIIPEFCYKPIYDPLHRMNVISSDPAKPDRLWQKGIREKLLCVLCEQKLSKWEDYAKRAFFGGVGITVVQDRKMLVISNLEYAKFRLFLLSLLWRMGASKDHFLEQVNLGAKHEEALRLALMREDPLDPLQYPCALIGVLIGGTFNPDGILPPSRVRGPNHQGYCVLIAGFLYHFFVMSHSPPREYADICISKAGQMRILVQEVRDIPFLAEIVHEFGTAVRSREQNGCS